MNRILHINSSESAGGVAEILSSLIYKFGREYECERYIIKRPIDFYGVTKKIHNDLHGSNAEYTEQEINLYNDSKLSKDNIDSSQYDLIVIHDPQPLPLITQFKKNNPNTKIVWRAHIPVDSNSFAWNNLLKEYVNMCDAAIFSMEDYVPDGLKIPHYIFHPCIDLNSIKNIQLDSKFKTKIIKDLGIETPYIVQISRFDKLKGVEELIKTYNKLARQTKNMEFILASDLAVDDPEGIEVYNELQSIITDDKVKIIRLDDDPGINKLQVNALQSDALLVIQNSTAEGFGLVVTEAMYKKKIVLTRNVGGLSLQIENGKNGFIYNTKVNLLSAINMIRDKDSISLSKISSNAKRSVIDNFSMGVLVSNYKKMLTELKGR